MLSDSCRTVFALLCKVLNGNIVCHERVDREFGVTTNVY